MKTSIKFSLRLILLLLLAGQGLSQETNPIQKTSIKDFKVTNISLRGALSRLSVEYRIPIGFEDSDIEHASRAKISLEALDVTLTEILDLLTDQNGHYRWEINEDVVNFVPVRGRHTLMPNLLSTRIGLFSPPRNTTNVQLGDYFANLRELGFVNKNPFSFKVFEDRIVERKMLIDDLIGLHNHELRSILNRVVKQSPSRFWYIRIIGKDLVFLDFC